MHALRGALILAVLSGCSAESPLSPANGGSGTSGHGGDHGQTPGPGGQTAFGGMFQSVTAGVGGNGGERHSNQAGASLGGSSSSAGNTSLGGGTSGESSRGGAGGGGAHAAAGDEAVRALREYLDTERAARPALASESFASVPLDRAQAKTAVDLLWADHVAFITATREAELDQKAISLDGKTLRYDFKVFGSKPESGRSLFISLHGGGEAAASVNDQQWENQKILYEPEEGIYLAPRAPTNTGILWHERHIDGLFQRLIEDLIVFQDVDPNRVYVMGYSAGGDGVYQLGPRMGDYWAAAAMMAGHPNDSKPDSLRNLGFTIHVGALDSAYDRNKKAEEWGELLDALRAQDPDGYPHEVQVHAGKPHWMDLEDAVAVPWLAGFTRNPIPSRVVWLQDDITHNRFYWLAVPPEEAKGGTKVVATYEGQRVAVESSQGIQHLRVRLSDAMLDLDAPLSITAGGTTLFEGRASRTIATLAKTLDERGDPALVFASEIELTLP